jgi:hypothetical protein
MTPWSTVELPVSGAYPTGIVDSLATMHRSRLVGILIDTPAAQVDAAVDFWSAALGAQAYPAPGEEQFTVLIDAAPGLFTVVQAVDDAPRYHVDIETDDLAAEVARLTALGAELVTAGRMPSRCARQVATSCVWCPCTAIPRRLPTLPERGHEADSATSTTSGALTVHQNLHRGTRLKGGEGGGCLVDRHDLEMRARTGISSVDTS